MSLAEFYTVRFHKIGRYKFAICSAHISGESALLKYHLEPSFVYGLKLATILGERLTGVHCTDTWTVQKNFVFFITKSKEQRDRRSNLDL